MTPKLLPFALLALLLAGCKPGQQDAAPQTAPTAPAEAVAPTAPAQPGMVQQTADVPQLQVQTVDGKAYDLASHRGQWVVVNFWATWCAPCLQEMPELSALHAMRSNVEVIGLAYEDIELDEMQAFLKEHPVAYPIAIIDTYNPPKDFATPRGLPMTYLIAPDGKVAKQFLGPVNAHEIEQAITAAGGKAV
ncbi:TlpA disulfide reductase family protein [Stenotrophomonas sp. Iso1]|uniref:TlpA family protein disulfide reductase n=1 Tax=Stenotrophomonas sp. Iso1 TaxID=2977283 RepID=UPI0022B7C519|nr:TlpA disulfide reductase family protein [Stenotrophomonas sp. Iso1]